MIQASELRLGNWLYASGNTIETYQTSKPKQVTIEFLNAIKVENEERPDAFLTWFSPIPLTPEVLEKCGFELRLDGDILVDYKLYPIYVKFQHNNGLLITILEYSSCSHIKHLHQLQNLYFALTGEELNYTP